MHKVLNNRKEIEINAYKKSIEKIDELINGEHLENSLEDKEYRRCLHIIRSNLESRISILSNNQRKNEKTKFLYKEGVVVNLFSDNKNFLSWVYEVKTDGLKKTSYYSLYTGLFNKNNAPKIGDVVILRSRVTNLRPDFDERYARIVEIKHRRKDYE